MDTAQVKEKKKLSITSIRIILVICILSILVLLNIVLEGRLLTTGSLMGIVSHAVFPAFVAWGMSFIFAGGITDLSIGANILLAANIGGLLAENVGLGYPGLIIGTLVTVIIFEHISVRCSVSWGIPSWIAGLGMALVMEAILSQYSTYLTQQLSEKLPIIKNYGALGKMPLMGIICLIGFVFAYFLYNRSSIGLNVRALGGNPKVAEAMGINRKKTIFLAALVGSLFIAVAAIIQISYNTKLNASSGLGSLSTIFKSLATVLLAQSFSRIISEPIGILLGAILITAMFNILTMLGVPSGTGQEICLGALVILCGIFSNIGNKKVVK